MAAGFAHIIKVAVAEDSQGLHSPQYQFSFNNGSSTFARTFTEEGLLDFLREDLGLRPALLDRVRDDLGTRSDSLISDIEFSDNDAAALGFAHVGSEV